MSATPTHPEPTSQASLPDEQRQRYGQMLYELAEMGMDIARTVHRRATAESEPAPAPAPDLTPAFDRIARTIRRTIALAQKLSDPTPPAPGALAGERAQVRSVVSRRQIIRAVEDTIERESDGPEAEALCAELYERLGDPELDDDLAQRPIADIIEDIRRDLGIAGIAGIQLWKRRTPQDVRDLCARAADPNGVEPRPARRPAHPQARRAALRTPEELCRLLAAPKRTGTGTGPPRS